MNIIELPIDSIIPYENNPRDNDEAVEFVANCIRRFGFRNPIQVDENNVIKVLGIAQALGWTFDIVK